MRRAPPEKMRAQPSQTTKRSSRSRATGDVESLGVFKFRLVTGLIFTICAALWWLFERNTPRVRRAMTEMFNSVVRPSAKT